MIGLGGRCDCFGLTETWLCDGIFDGELFILDDYDVFRSDRDYAATGCERGGGVLLATHRKLKAKKIDIPDLINGSEQAKRIDIAAVEVKLNTGTVVLVVVYVPPACSYHQYEVFVDTFITLRNLYGRDIIIMGDFNIPEFLACRGGLTSSPNFFQVSRLAEFYNIDQYNEIVNKNKRILDLVFSSRPVLVERMSEPVVPEDGHHPALSISLNIDRVAAKWFPTIRSNEFNFRKANFLELYSSLSLTDWSFLDGYDSVNAAVNAFYSKLYSIFEQFVPKKRNGKLSRTYPPWFDSGIINNIKRKHILLKKYKRTGCEEIYREFTALRSQLKNEIALSFSKYQADVEADVKLKPNKFWSFINSKNRTPPIPSRMSYQGVGIGDPQGVVDGFAAHFSDSFAAQTSVRGDVPDAVADSVPFGLISVDVEDVADAMKRLKADMTMGPDSVPGFLIRDCSPVLSEPLTAIFKLIFKTSTFPDMWKTSRVCPVHKKGKRDEITNYRPISIISNFSKIFEIVLYNKINRHVSYNLSPDQHGFVRGRSTITNLACKSQFICESLDGGGQVDVIYTDMSKAFDRISHDRLCSKLRGFGFSDSFARLIKSYLSDRRQFVQHNGYRSTQYMQTSGVPQGSILGPLFFNIFINDIASRLSVKSLLYADDLKLFCEVRSLSDCERLQGDLDLVCEWCDVNGLSMNASKCSVMSYTRRLTAFTHNYCLRGTVLHRPHTIKDLGVTFDPKFTFSKHVEVTALSAFRGLGFVLRNGKGFGEDALRSLYAAFVRSRLEYGSLIWDPIYKVHGCELEKVQRRFLKAVCCAQDGFYPPRGFPQNTLLERFNFTSLEDRRMSNAVKFLHKLVHGVIDCVGLVNRIEYRVPRLSSRRSNVFNIPTPRTNILKMSPIYKMYSYYSSIESDFDIFL